MRKRSLTSGLKCMGFKYESLLTGGCNIQGQLDTTKKGISHIRLQISNRLKM